MSRRAKLWKSDNDGEWVDQGTGFVECVTLADKMDSMCIVLKKENEDEILLSSKILPQDIYTRQQDTLILWTEPVIDSDDYEEGIELALSFQDAEACNEIWEEICDVQRSIRAAELFGDINFTLPTPNLSHIDDVQKMLMNKNKQALAQLILREKNYFEKLVDLWKMVEDMSMSSEYRKMYSIFKDLILLNNPKIIEEAVSDKFVYDVMATLQHDPESGIIGQTKHAEFLRERVKFKEVVPLNNPSLEAKIHQTFRLQYLKDVALARVLDESTFSTINSIIFVNNLQIITEILNNDKIIIDLFLKIKEDVNDNNNNSNEEEERIDQLCFISEMCDLAKNLEPKSKLHFYQSLVKNGLFEILEKTLVSPEARLRMLSSELLLNTVEIDSNLLRSYILKQEPDYSMLQLIVTQVDVDPETGVKNLITDIIRLISDVTTMEEGVGKITFLNLIYQRFATQLFSPLSRPLPKRTHSEAESLLKSNLCELLGYFVHHHIQHTSSYLLNKPIIKNSLNLLGSKEKFLVLAALRFLRSFIEVDNISYHKYIIDENMFEPIIQLFLSNGNRYNLLNSAILDLFELIHKKNYKSLLQHFVEKFEDKVKEIDYVDTFKRLKELNERNLNPPQTSTPSSGELELESRPFIDLERQRQKSKYEEEQRESAWFDDDEDDEDFNPASFNDDGGSFERNLFESTTQNSPDNGSRKSRKRVWSPDDNMSVEDGVTQSPSKKKRTSNEETGGVPSELRDNQ
eukprot:TRINITY_DN10331_c0_g1_i1.p1 TRINITY_DN10331_c0_g1~~TRINITY_DN10331_c0_g1_i1.p1  ORF type:complete len:744 (+),score=85.65 TRINITY_DN10331_c0_g1_i1:100-2331(+)